MQHEEKSWLCFALCVLFVFVQRINSQQHDDGTGPYTNDVLETSVDYAFPRSAILQDYEYATITRILVRESRGNSLLVGWDGSIVRVTRDGSVSRGKIPVHDYNKLCRFIDMIGTLEKDYRGMDRSIDCSKYWVLIYADKANWTFCFDAHRLPEDVWAIVLIIRQLSEDVDWKSEVFMKPDQHRACLAARLQSRRHGQSTDHTRQPKTRRAAYQTTQR